MKRALIVSAALAVSAASLARADIAPRQSSGCGHKQPGATCKRDDGSAGVCIKTTYKRLAPGSRVFDGKTVDAPIVLCELPAADGGSKDGG